MTDIIGIGMDQRSTMRRRTWVSCNLTNCNNGCCGISSLSSFLCYDAECFCCRFFPPDADADKWCTCHASETYLSNSFNRCKCYQQVCCIEFFCTLAGDGKIGEEFKPHEKVLTEPTRHSKKGTIRAGLCCCVALLDHRYPQCWGCHRYSQMCCCVDETLSCKPLWYSAHTSMKRREDQCFLLGRHRCNCLRNNIVCMKCTDEWCGQACRCACPTDHDVPCVFTPLPYCTLCAKGRCFLACCAKLQDLPGYVVPHNDADYRLQLLYDVHPPQFGDHGQDQVVQFETHERENVGNGQTGLREATPQVVYAGTAVYAEAVPGLASADAGYDKKVEAMQVYR